MRRGRRKKQVELESPRCPFWGDFNYVPGAIVCVDDVSGKKIHLRLTNGHMATKTAYKNKYCQHDGFYACANYKELAAPYEEGAKDE